MMAGQQEPRGRYGVLFRRLEEERRGAFVPFVMMGDPTPELSLEILRTLVRAGADALELGIPFSDPVADGPTIQAAGIRALAAGTTPATCMKLLRTLRDEAPTIPVGLLVYANLVVARGMERFYGRVADGGVDSVLVADVPSIEARPFAEAARTHGVDPVLIAPPNARPASLEAIARLGRGYTYIVTRPGVTGAVRDLRLEHGELLTRLAGLGAPPGVMGFGISRPEHVRQALTAGAAGAISGSAVVNIIATHLHDHPSLLEALGAFVGPMRAATSLER